MAVSHAPAIAGEDMSLDLVGAGKAIELRVRVLDSRPVIIEGAVRHRIRLAVLLPAASIDLPSRRAISGSTSPVMNVIAEAETGGV